MKIALGCDHGGYALKEHIKAYLESKGHEVKDCGTYSTESCDYPIFGEAAARKVQSGRSASAASSSAPPASASPSPPIRSRASAVRCAASPTARR